MKDKFITISGVDKQLVGEVAHCKDTRKPDHYTRKRNRYAGEYLKLKPGKKQSSRSRLKNMLNRVQRKVKRVRAKLLGTERPRIACSDRINLCMVKH